MQQPQELKFKSQKQGFLKVILLLIGLVIIGYLIMPYLNDKNVKQFGFYLAPLLSGFVVAGFAYGIVYVDSLKPGVKPPIHLPPKPNGCSQLQLGYVGAITSGAIVTLIMYVNS